MKVKDLDTLMKLYFAILLNVILFEFEEGKRKVDRLNQPALLTLLLVL